MIAISSQNSGSTFGDPASRVGSIMETVSVVVLNNMLWVACSLPVITMGAATKALYQNLHAWKQDEPCSVGAFFRHMKEDFGAVTGVWAVTMVLLAFLIADGWLVIASELSHGPILLALLVSVGLTDLVVISMAIPLLSRFRMGFKQAFLGGFLLGMGHLPRMIPVVAMNLIPVAMILCTPNAFLAVSCLWLLCGFSIIVRINLRLLAPVLNELDS